MSGSGYLMKVNSNGEKIWEKSYSNEGPVYAICESKQRLCYYSNIDICQEEEINKHLDQ